MAEKRRRAADAGAPVLVAKVAFYHGGKLVLAGHTVEAGHPMLKGRGELFAPFTPTWPVEHDEDGAGEGDGEKEGE